MEYYGGNYCEYLYNMKPEFGIKIGTLETEKVLINTDLLYQISSIYNFGIYSGRNKNEFELVKSKLGFANFSDDFVFLADGSSPCKPDPEPLFNMVNLVPNRGVIFIGDSFDDYQTVVNFKKNFCDMVLLF